MSNRIKIAVDVCVGRNKMAELTMRGYEVVVSARESESDESWLNRALTNGAKFAISQDADVPRLIERRKMAMVWIDYPIDLPEHKPDMIGYIESMIKFKMKLFKTYNEEVPSSFGFRLLKLFGGKT